MKNFNFKSILSIIIISLFISAMFVYADWTSPPAGAPVCPASEPACNAPLNVGSQSQYKTGALGIGGIIQGYSNAYFSGNVGIGTTNPGAKLEIKDGKQRFSQTFTSYNTNGPYTWCQASCPSGGQGQKWDCTCQTNKWQTGSTCAYNSFMSGGNNYEACVYTANIQAQNITKIVECGVDINGSFSCTTIQ